MSQLRRIYHSIKSANPTLNDGKAKQQAWVLRDRMMFENVAVASSSAAGGAGGGRKKVTVPTIEAVTGLSYLITWVDPDTDTYKFFVFNHSTGALSTTVDTELISDFGNEWGLQGITSVQEKGFSMQFSNSNLGNIYKLYYIDFNGNIIDFKDLDFLQGQENFYSNVLIYGTLNELTFIYTFDGEKVTSYQLDRPVEQLSIYGVTKNNQIVVLDPQSDLFDGVPTAYLGLSDGALLSLPDLLGEEQLLDLNNNFIVAIDSKNYINIVSEEGTLLNTYDLTGKGIKNWSTSAYGENSVYYLLDDGTTAEMMAYDGDSNQFSSFTFSLDISQTRPTYYSKKQWQAPIPSFGTTLTQVSIDGSFFLSSSGTGYLGKVNDIWWLPKGQTEFLQHSLFDLEEVYFQDPKAGDGTKQSFTEGANPVIIFSTQSSPIYVGFLTDTGFVTQSTGVNMDNLAGTPGVFGGKVGDYTFAGYNQNNENITWQIYGENSILETFTTSINFSLGNDSISTNMYGTLMILDTSGDASASYPSYVYTTEIGLQEVFLSNGDVWNNTTYGNRTGLASEFQIITQVSETGDITGFCLLSNSGLSDLKDITSLLEGDGHGVNQVSVGDSMISFDLVGVSTAVIKELFEYTNQTFKDFPPVAGTYQGVEASTNGSGTGLIFDVVVTGPDESDIFTITATLVDGGTGFQSGDDIYLDTQFLGGTGSDETSTYTLGKADSGGSYNRIITFNKSTLNLITNLKQIDASVYFYSDRVIVENFDESNTILNFSTITLSLLFIFIAIE